MGAGKISGQVGRGRFRLANEVRGIIVVTMTDTGFAHSGIDSTLLSARIESMNRSGRTVPSPRPAPRLRGRAFPERDFARLGPLNRQRETSNIQHPTSNIQGPESAPLLDVRCWMLAVGCFPLSVKGAKARKVPFGEFSLLQPGRGPGRGGRSSAAAHALNTG